MCGYMLSEFEKRIADLIVKRGLFGAAEGVAVAVSGGADSMALLHVMCALKKEGVFEGQKRAVHFNHQLRGAQADGDERFVVEECERLGVEVVTRRLDVRGFAREGKLSIETAARQLRIEGLVEIAKDSGLGVIATAHHRDDNAETILQRLARGTGFRGLGGIWPVRELGGLKFVRPMLGVSRAEVIEYLEGKDISWREDATNANVGFRRNFIRHRLLPALQADSGGDLTEQLSELSAAAQGLSRRVSLAADEAWGRLAEISGGKVVFELKGFAPLPEIVKVELVRRGLVLGGSGERDLMGEQYERVLELVKQKSSGKVVEASVST